MQRFAGWGALLAIAIILMIVGARGRLGSAMGALITPSAMEDVKPNG